MISDSRSIHSDYTSDNLSQNMLIKHKVVYVGDISVGKTSIIYRLIENKFKETYDPSIGIDFSSVTLKYKSRPIKIQIWDSAGQEKYKSLIPSYIKGSSIIFLVYDVTNKESYNNLTNWIKFIRDLETSNIVLLANKIDVSKELIKVNKSEGEKFAKDNKLKFYELSAKENTNVKYSFLSSVSNLSFFDSFRQSNDKENNLIISELENENNDLTGPITAIRSGDTSRIDISIAPDNFNDTDKKCNC